MYRLCVLYKFIHLNLFTKQAWPKEKYNLDRIY